MSYRISQRWEFLISYAHQIRSIMKSPVKTWKQFGNPFILLCKIRKRKSWQIPGGHRGVSLPAFWLKMGWGGGVDRKKEWKAETRRVSHKEEGQGDAERRRQMKRPGRKTRPRTEGWRGTRKTLREHQRGGLGNRKTEGNKVTTGGKVRKRPVRAEMKAAERQTRLSDSGAKVSNSFWFEV